MKAETYDYLCENALNRAIKDVLQSIPEHVQNQYSLSYLNNFDNKKKQFFKSMMFREEMFVKNFLMLVKMGKN